MKMDEVLVIKLDCNGFEHFYNQKMRESGCTVHTIEEYRWKKYGLSGLRRQQLQRLSRQELARYRLIVVFEELALYRYLKKRVDPQTTKLVLWNWNITNKTDMRGDDPMRRRCENWTFDEGDARKFGWKLNDQFYFMPDALPARSREGALVAFSACVDKGRYPLMKQMREVLRTQGVTTDFCLVREPFRRYAAEDAAWVRKSGLSYEQFLQHTIRSDLVVEVVFYNKKLITNNAAIRKTPLYHPDNVLIWEPGAAERLAAFLQAEYQPLPDEVKKRYTFETWLENFWKPQTGSGARP